MSWSWSNQPVLWDFYIIFLLVASLWMFVTVFCPKRGVTGDVWRHAILTFHTAFGETGGKSLHALVGSAASGGEINFNIILSTLWWDEKAFLYKVIFKFVLMYRNNIEFYPFFAIEWTAEWTDKNSHWCISSTILHLSAQKMDSKLQVSFWWHQLPSGPITSWL